MDASVGLGGEQVQGVSVDQRHQGVLPLQTRLGAFAVQDDDRDDAERGDFAAVGAELSDDLRVPVVHVVDVGHGAPPLL